MSDLWSSRRLCVPLPAIASTLGLVLVAASVMDVLADHAIGPETQIAWQAQLLKVEEALVWGDLAKGRQTYLTALFRARSEGSVEGVLRTAERFAELGDRGVVEQWIRVAAGRGQLARSADGGVRPGLHGVLGG